MTRKLDITGQRYGRLTAIKRTTSKHNSRWICRCDCGNETIATLCHLRAHHTTSCGCRHGELMDTIGERRKTHGHTVNGANTPTYWSWAGMMSRCNNPTNTHFKHYGGRGIKVSVELSTFEGFLSVLGIRPIGLELGRIDNNRGYASDNVRWETPAQNARNKSTTKWLNIDGQTKSAAEWCDIYNIPWSRLKHRLNSGCDPKVALTTPKGRLHTS